MSETLPRIGKLLGHAWLNSTARYAHLNDADVIEACNRIGDLTTVSVRFRTNLPVAMPNGQRRRDNHCGCRAVDKISVAEASENTCFSNIADDRP